ncbi:MAG: hypothetical protein U1C74_11395, partial [Phenylobacterium sp.]|nr:hypothetical protein [Phenylobacterium sp.]
MRKPRSFAIPRLAALAASAALVAGAAVAQPGTAEIVAYRGATLIDGLGGVARPGMVVVVKGERIIGVTPVADFDRTPTADARVVDSTGLYVLPGLIDSHVHLATVPARARAEATLRRQLFSGVTAVRDMAGDGRALADLSRSALLGELAAPDIRYAALIAGPGFFDDPRPRATARGATAGDAPWMQAVTAATDLPRAIARAEGTWAAGVKIYSDVPPQLLAPIVAESHRQGLQVWSHGAIFPSRPSEVIAAGVDTISHACVLDYEFAQAMPPRYASEPTATFTASATDFAPIFAEMRRRNVILDATLFAYGQRGFDAPGSPNRVLACDDSRASQITGWAWRA